MPGVFLKLVLTFLRNYYSAFAFYKVNNAFRPCVRKPLKLVDVCAKVSFAASCTHALHGNKNVNNK